MPANLETLSLIATIVLAFLGYIVTYFNSLATARRAERLQLITSQINELYGPMYVITQTGAPLLNALHAKGLLEGRIYVNQDAPQDPSQVSEWRIWVETVFVPMNERLADIIVQKSHLIREAEMPPCLQDFMVHQAGYRALVRKWELGDFSESTSLTRFPAEIAQYARTSYQELKQEQLRIIAINSKPYARKTRSVQAG